MCYNCIGDRIFPSTQSPKVPKNIESYLLLSLLSLHCLLPPVLPRMSVQPISASSPIVISSDSCARPISISSDLSPARASDVFSPPYATHWKSQITDRSISLGSPGLGSRLASPTISSRVPATHTTRVSYPANLSRPGISSRSAAPNHHNVEFELAQLREQCESLRKQCEATRAENSELRGRVEALRYIFIRL